MPEKIIKETVRKDGEVEKKEVKVKDKLQSEFNQWIPYHVVTIRLYKKNSGSFGNNRESYILTLPYFWVRFMLWK